MSFRFADFEIDVARQELRRGGATIHIEPQVFDVLVHLVRNHNRTVSREELVDTVWKGRVVSEAALSSRIAAARKAIGDTGNDQRLIRTVHKRGFRFVGEVADAPDTSASHGDDAPVAFSYEEGPSSRRSPPRPGRSRFPTSRRSPCCRSRT